LHAGDHAPEVESRKQVPEHLQALDTRSWTESRTEEYHEQERNASKNFDSMEGKVGIDPKKDERECQGSAVHEDRDPKLEVSKPVDDGVDYAILNERDN